MTTKLEDSRELARDQLAEIEAKQETIRGLVAELRAEQALSRKLQVELAQTYSQLEFFERRYHIVSETLAVVEGAHRSVVMGLNAARKEARLEALREAQNACYNREGYPRDADLVCSSLQDLIEAAEGKP